MKMTETNPLTLASALDYIASNIDCNSLDSFLETGGQESDYICETLQITPLQAALFATILEKSGDDLATTRDLVSTLKVSKIRFLGFKGRLMSSRRRDWLWQDRSATAAWATVSVSLW